mgnify:CR=1 FL=1
MGGFVERGYSMIKYAKIVDKKLDVINFKEQYYKPAERVAVEKTIIATKEPAYKPVRFAPIPEFDQTKQAVYQESPVDKGDYIEVGVKVVDVPPEKEPIFDEPVEPIIKK